VLMLFSPDPNAFSELQLELVEAAALQVAPAIYNAELYKLIREQADQLGGMVRGKGGSSQKRRYAGKRRRWGDGGGLSWQGHSLQRSR